MSDTYRYLLTVIRIGSIVAFVVFGFFVAGRETIAVATPLPATMPDGPAGGLLAALGVGMIAALWTYDGWYGPTFSAGEMKRPERTLPLDLRGLFAVFSPEGSQLAATDDDHVGLFGGHREASSPRNSRTSASACASMKSAASVS